MVCHNTTPCIQTYTNTTCPKSKWHIFPFPWMGWNLPLNCCMRRFRFKLKLNTNVFIMDSFPKHALPYTTPYAIQPNIQQFISQRGNPSSPSNPHNSYTHCLPALVVWRDFSVQHEDCLNENGMEMLTAKQMKIFYARIFFNQIFHINLNFSCNIKCNWKWGFLIIILFIVIKWCVCAFPF